MMLLKFGDALSNFHVLIFQALIYGTKAIYKKVSTAVRYRRRSFLCSIFLLFFANHAVSDLPPLSAFSNLPSVTGLQLSPSGSRLIYLQNGAQGSQDAGKTVLSFSDMNTGEKKFLLTSDNERVKFKWVKWANDDIVLASVRFETEKSQRTVFYQTRLLKIDVTKDKPEAERFIRPRTDDLNLVKHHAQFQDNVISWLPNDPKHILMQIDLDEPALPSVYRINVYNKKRTRLERGKLKVRNWIADQQGNLRIGLVRDYEKTNFSYIHRKGKKEKFETLFEGDLLSETDVDILGFALDPNILYYRAYDKGFKALYRMDLTTRERVQVLKHDQYDVGGQLIYSSKTQDAIGLYDAHSDTGKFYFDDSSSALARGLKKAFGREESVNIVSMSQDETRYVALVHSGATPPDYFIGDRKAKTLDYLLAQYPLLNDVALSKNKKVLYTARDKTEIEAYLSLPLFGEAPYPMVMHPHGGPGARDYDGFDPWVSYMTSRGYAVFRPNFRGSAGFGYEFAKAQMGRWGLEMQDDITDGAQWLINEGIADPDKFCIFGASYGGYATKMAAVKTPDLFTCAASFAGVSDLQRLYSQQKRYLGGEVVADVQLGESSKDRKRRSPINGVDKIKIPMLIMHGSEDIVVQVVQSRAFVDKLKKSGVEHKYVQFKRGDHYLSIQRNRTQFFEELDQFFQKHLGSVEDTGPSRANDTAVN